MIYFILFFAFVVASIIMYDMPKKKPKQPKKNKHTVPASFWDDYNHCILSINKMTIEDTARVENLIDNLMYQYVELIEYCFYIEKMSILVDAYNKRVKTFLLSNNLN
jgi:hypothetical protein